MSVTRSRIAELRFTEGRRTTWSGQLLSNDMGFLVYENSVVNSRNIKLNLDGSFTTYFGSKELCVDVPNHIDTPDGLNFIMRVYLPTTLWS